MKNVFYIEDNPADVLLLETAIKFRNLNIDVQIFSNGKEVLDYIKKLKADNYNKIPDLIISDLNLPKVTGKELIAELKKDEVFKKIPLIVCSTSNSELDKDDCNKLGVASYHVKSINFDDTLDLVTYLNDIYLNEKHEC